MGLYYLIDLTEDEFIVGLVFLFYFVPTALFLFTSYLGSVYFPKDFIHVYVGRDSK